MKAFIGKNKQWVVVWNCRKQAYTVFLNNKYFVTKYRFNDVKSYLN